jgi:ParB/RepB/Spo0J family partition protein
VISQSFSEESIMSTPDLRVIPISEIRENPVALRAVNRESEDYLGLRDSIRDVGILNAINVRERTEEVDGQEVKFFELCDGLHRYTAATDVGLTKIPVQVISLDDARILEAQIMANVHRIATKPVAYTKQLQRIFAANPTLTLAEMAARVAKSPAWISQRLNLLKLEPTIQAAVDDGKITVSNAVQLAKLPVEEQPNYVDPACTMGSEEFVPMVLARVKEIRDAAREGRASGPAEFVAVARLQKMSALKAEHETAAVGPQLCKKSGAKTPVDGFALGVAWALSLDPVSVEVRTEEDRAKKAQQAEEKKKREAERAKKRAEAAAKLAADAEAAVNENAATK